MSDDEYERDLYRVPRVNRSREFAAMRERLGVESERVLTREELLELAVARLKARGEALRSVASYNVEVPR